ncbi:hypothetical protein AMAG_10583 [Allomyces macrogynus ATCC 38327]|uniref:Uncharacterized protein n=1 Tax=Allomyces macrogynus (strain ATCC 38327) TaxID=578462 RepID=A0A0L0SQY6_ALLM3|nr:hypothetical protein AMAG_10583 [Allomyces macrogynus ATCC 38327]|eukprot:KNE64916.1 hypothetical protein AMAG_10583 [Allomyces macrogynus ATCC 38327]
MPPPSTSTRRATAPTNQPSALAMVLALAVLAWAATNLVGLSYATSMIRDVRAAATSARVRSCVRQLVWALIACPFATFARVIAWPFSIVNRVVGAAARLTPRRASAVASPSSSPPSLNLRHGKPDWSNETHNGPVYGVAQALAALVAMDDTEGSSASSRRVLPRRRSVERLVAPACEGEDMDVMCDMPASE